MQHPRLGTAHVWDSAFSIDNVRYLPVERRNDRKESCHTCCLRPSQSMWALAQGMLGKKNKLKKSFNVQPYLNSSNLLIKCSYLHFLIVDVGSKKGWLKKVSADRKIWEMRKGNTEVEILPLKQHKYTDQNPYDPSDSSGAAPAEDLPVEETSLSGCCEQKALVI